MIKSKYNFSVGELLKTRDSKETFLTYLGEVENTNTENKYRKKRKVLVKCKCGKKWGVQLGNILNGNTICCGKNPCRTYKSLSEEKRDPEVGYKALLYTYKKHAKERNLSFDLNYDLFKSLLNKNCHYCGVIPKQIYKLCKKGTDIVRSGIPIVYNGIDRIDSKKNYTEDNVVSCCKVCNRAKMDMTYSDFLEWSSNLYNNLLKNNFFS